MKFYGATKDDTKKPECDQYEFLKKLAEKHGLTLDLLNSNMQENELNFTGGTIAQQQAFSIELNEKCAAILKDNATDAISYIDCDNCGGQALKHRDGLAHCKHCCDGRVWRWK